MRKERSHVWTFLRHICSYSLTILRECHIFPDEGQLIKSRLLPDPTFIKSKIYFVLLINTCTHTWILNNQSILSLRIPTLLV